MANRALGAHEIEVAYPFALDKLFPYSVEWRSKENQVAFQVALKLEMRLLGRQRYV